MRKFLYLFVLLGFSNIIYSQITVVVTQKVPGALCSGQDSKFVCTVKGLCVGTTITKYQWKVDAVNVAGVNDTLTLSTLAGGQIVSCDVTVGGAPCGGPTIPSNDLTVSVTSANLSLAVNDVPVCGTDAEITVSLTETGLKYEAFLAETSLGSTIGDGSDKIITIPYASFKNGINNVEIKVTNGTCVFSLTDKSKVTNSGGIVNLETQGNTLCTGSNGDIVLKGTEKGVVYECYMGLILLTSGTGTGSDINLNIDASKLVSGENTLSFKIVSTKPACIVEMTSTATVNIIPVPADDILVSGDSLCNISDGKVKLLSSSSGLNYEAKLGSFTSTSISGTGSAIDIVIPKSNLKLGNNLVSFRVFSGGCSTNLINKATVFIGKPDSLQAVSGSTFCEGSNGTVTINSSEPGVEYTAKIGETLIDSKKGDENPIEFTILNTYLSEGTNTVKLTATRSACISNLPDVVVIYNLNPVETGISGDVVCGDIPATITISETSPEIKYEILLDTISIASGVGIGGDLVISLDNNILAEGDNTIGVKAVNTNTGCKNTYSSQTIVNIGAYPNLDLIMPDMDVCTGEKAHITITDAETDVTYVLFKDNEKTQDSITGLSKIDFEIEPVASGYYSLYAKNDANCNQMLNDSSVITLKVCELGIPEGFSPNGDGINDVFEITGIASYPKTSLIILNRWGNKVFETRRYKNDWNGTASTGLGDKNLPVGTYYYIIKKNDGSDPIKGQLYIAR